MMYESRYLSHHGIKGQKWGVRRFQNPDGTLTEEGKKRYRPDAMDGSKQYRSDVMNSAKQYAALTNKHGYSWEDRKRMSENLSEQLTKKYSELADAQSKYREATKEWSQYSANGALMDKYATLKGIIDAKEYGVEDPEEIKSWVWANKYDDLDQGYRNSFDLYLIDNGISPKEYSAREFEADDNRRAVEKKIVDQLLQEQKDELVPNAKSTWETYERVVSEMLSIASDYGGEATGSLDEAEAKQLLQEAYKEYDRYKDV